MKRPTQRDGSNGQDAEQDGAAAAAATASPEADPRPRHVQVSSKRTKPGPPQAGPDDQLRCRVRLQEVPADWE